MTSSIKNVPTFYPSLWREVGRGGVGKEAILSSGESIYLMYRGRLRPPAPLLLMNAELLCRSEWNLDTSFHRSAGYTDNRPPLPVGHFTPRLWLQTSGGSNNFERGGVKTIYKLRPQLLQMRTTKYMPFTRKKRLFDKKYEPIAGGGGRPKRPLWILHCPRPEFFCWPNPIKSNLDVHNFHPIQSIKYLVLNPAGTWT